MFFSNFIKYRGSNIKRGLITAFILLMFIFQSNVSAPIAMAGEPTYWSTSPRDGWTTTLDYNPYRASFGTVGPRDDGDYEMWVSINGEKQSVKYYSLSTPCSDCLRWTRYYYKFRRGVNEVILYDSAFEGSAHGPSETRLVYLNPSGDYVEPEKNLGSTGGFFSFFNSANVINPATGNKFIIETDFKGPGPFPLTFKRYYNSINEYAGGSKFWDYWNRWRTYYDRTLAKITDTIIHIKRPDGKLYIFTKSILDEWVTDSDVLDKLEVDGAGYRYTSMDGVIEHYNTDGVLQSMEFYYLSLSLYMGYDTEGRLSTVSDQWGRTLQFAYDPTTGRLSTITDPTSCVYTYRYDTDGNLSEVEFPGGEKRTYLYEDTANERLLTGIIDENNKRLFTWQYDSEGRVIHQDKAGDEVITLSYDSDTTTSATDGSGKTTTYYYDVQQGVKKRTGTEVSCTGCTTKTSSISYDSNGRISSVTDFEGNQSTFTYNLKGQEISRTEAVGTPQERTITTQWSPSSLNLPTRVITPEKTTDYTYNTGGKVLTKTETDPDTSQTRTWTYTYNTQNLISSVDGPRTDVTDVTTYTYDSMGNRLTAVNALGHTINYTSYDAVGRLLSVTYANGLVVDYTYGCRNQVLTKTIGGSTITNTYDSGRRLIRRDFSDGTYLAFTYDSADRIIQMEDGEGNSLVYDRDDRGNITEKKILDPSQNIVFRSTQNWDIEGNLQSVANAQGQATLFAYSQNGQRITATDPLSNTSTYAYDSLGRRNQSIDAESGVRAYDYNTADQMVNVTDPLNLTTNYTYDGFGNLLTENSPDTGQTTHTYDMAGNLLTRTDANGITTTLAWDAVNRLTSLTFPNSQYNVSYTYDQGATGTGRLTGMSDRSGSYSFAYDVNGNLTQETKTILGVQYDISYTYDNLNRITSITYPSGRVVNYIRDQYGKVINILTTGGQVVAQNITYLPWGPVTGLQYGNGINQTRTYDQNYWLTAKNETPLFNYSIGRNAVGKVTSLTDSLHPEDNQTFDYNNVYRLTSATGAYGNYTYTYDLNGNRLSKTYGGQTDTYSYTTGSNRLASISGLTPETYTYDANGSIIQRLNQVFTYDQDNRMIRAVINGTQQTDYTINGFGQRIVKTNSQQVVVYHYDRFGNLIAESDDTGQVIKEYIYFQGQLVALADNMGLVFVHNGLRNEPVKLTNSIAVVIWKASYEPFGKATVDEDPDGNGVTYTLNVRLPGQYYDVETGLYYNYKRNYDPRIGRYFRTDPMGFESGDLNLYNYCWGDPMNWIDPRGEAFLAALWVFIKVLAVLLAKVFFGFSLAKLALGYSLYGAAKLMSSSLRSFGGGSGGLNDMAEGLDKAVDLVGNTMYESSKVVAWDVGFAGAGGLVNFGSKVVYKAIEYGVSAALSTYSGFNAFSQAEDIAISIGGGGKKGKDEENWPGYWPAEPEVEPQFR